MTTTTDELAGRRLLILAEMTEAAARTGAAFDKLSAASTLENFGVFFEAFSDAAHVIVIDGEQAVIRITLETVSQLTGTAPTELLVPTREVALAEAATASMLNILEARYVGALVVSNERMVLHGAQPVGIAARRLADLHGDLPEGMMSLYHPARTAFVAEVRSAVAVMGQIAWVNALALNGVA